MAIGILVLLVLLTASLEKIISDIKNKNLRAIIYRKNLEIAKIDSEYNYLKEIMESKFKE